MDLLDIPKMFYKRQDVMRNAFTLAETLITLVIVGIVAALTIPNLIIQHQKEETVTRLKKVYSTLSQTTNRAIADNGPTNTWIIEKNGEVYDIAGFLKKYMLPYLSLSKDLTTSSKSSVQYKYLNGARCSFDGRNPMFYLSDGMSVRVGYFNSENRIQLYVDINGDKKPNIIGKDMFYFSYLLNVDKGFIVPTGKNNSRTLLTQSCSHNSLGYDCAALIMKDGWRIADDYPW